MPTRDSSDTTLKDFLYVSTPVLLIGILADQASKSWAVHEAAQPRMIVPGYLAAYSMPNAGSILGIGRDQAWTSMLCVLVSLAVATLLMRIVDSDRARWPRADNLASALLLGGIVGNTVDRLALGHVRDFLITWAIPNLCFNVADLLAVVGATSLLFSRFPGHRPARPQPGFTG